MYFVGFGIISLSFRHLEPGTAYLRWSGIGSLLVIGFAVFFFKESLSLSKRMFFVMVIVGVAGIGMTS